MDGLDSCIDSFMKVRSFLVNDKLEIGLQYVKFCLVGGSGVAVDMLVLHFLASPGWLGWNLTLSKVIAAEVAMFNNFLWNDGWTFRGWNGPLTINRSASSPHPSPPFRMEERVPEGRERRQLHGPSMGQRNWCSWLVRLAKFNLICTAGIVLSVGLLNLQVYWLGVNVYLANFISIVVVSFWNFFLNRRFGWVTPRASHGAETTVGAQL